MRSIRSLSLRNLAAASLWSHRAAVAAWSAGVGIVMVLFAYSFRGMVETFAGGAAGFAAAAQATAEAMRPLSGPAFRLDTYAGYVTYHNVGMWSLLLAIYAAIQGALCLRGLEERGVMQMYVAASSRSRVLAARLIGFAGAMVLIAVGTGAGMALGLLAGGDPGWPAGFGLAAEIALTASVFYALALVVSQLVSSARVAAGSTATFAVAAFVLTNIYEQLGAFGALRFASPFFYLMQSRFVMVAGHHADLPATVALVAMPVAVGALAWPLFMRRDLDAAAIRSPIRLRHREWMLRSRRVSVRSLWMDFVREQWLSVVAWAGGAFTLELVYMRIFPQVQEIWQTSEIVKALISTAGGKTLVDGFISFSLSFVAIVAAAYSVVQASRWLRDHAEGRDEMYLAGAPISRLRLNLERWIALLVGLVVVSVAAVAGLALGAMSTGQPLDFGGLVRTSADVVLVGVAVGGMSAAIATWLRSGLALAVLGTVLAVSYLLTVIRPLFSWPEWTAHLSLFDAFGFPYTGVPAPLGLAILAVLAVGGAAIAGTITQRRSTA